MLLNDLKDSNRSSNFIGLYIVAFQKIKKNIKDKDKDKDGKQIKSTTFTEYCSVRMRIILIL